MVTRRHQGRGLAFTSSFIERQISRRLHVVLEEVTKGLATPRPEYLWPEVLSSMSKSSQQKGRRYWAVETPKLDNFRKLRGIYDIDPDDVVFKDTMKNALKNLEVPLECAMPCKSHITTKHGETRRSLISNKRKTRYACVIEAHESTRTREDHIAEKEFNSLSYCSQAKKSGCKSRS